MKRKVLFIEFFLLNILFILIILLLTSIIIKAETFTVDDDGIADFTSIQDAINSSKNGDTIYVINGTYYENLRINKSINFIGEIKERTIINGNGRGNAINISFNWVNITGFTISSTGYGIKLYESSFNNISNNIISNNGNGIYCFKSYNNIFYQNEITRNLVGVVNINSTYNLFKENNVSSNTADGFGLHSSDYNLLISNTIFNNQTGIQISSSNYNFISGNTISNDHIGIWIRNSEFNDISNNSIIYNNQGISLVVFSNENKIKYNNVSFNEYGIDIGAFTKNNTISNNLITYNKYGIYIEDSVFDSVKSNNTIINNTLINNKIDVYREDFEINTLALIFGSSILSIVTIFTAGTEIGKYKFLFFLFPLYTRLNKDTVLDQYTRGKIHGYIIANPGAHYNIIKRKLKLKNGTLAYHLNVLEREDIIKSKRDGIYKRFFPYELTSLEMKIIEDNEHKLKRKHKKILEIITEKPGITQKDIILHTNYTQPTVNYNIRFLLENDLIYSQKDGREIKYFLKSIE